MKCLKEILQLFFWSQRTFLIIFEILNICIANVNSESLSTKSSTNKFYYDGRQHDLPTITITSDSKIENNGSYWKIWGFPNSSSSGLSDEQFLFAIEAKATFPLYTFSNISKNVVLYTEDLDINLPNFRQKRYIQDYWNKSSYVFEISLYVQQSFVILFQNYSFEFRSNIDPFFGVSVRYHFDPNENTVIIQTRPEIPVDLYDYFNQLTHQKKDENCEAHFFVQQNFDPATGTFQRRFGCYFANGQRGYKGIISTIINFVYFTRYAAGQKCISWCKHNLLCDEKVLWTPPNKQQWSSIPFCYRLNQDFSEVILFPPVYVSLPQGKAKAAEIYFGLGSVNMDRMISMDPFEEYQENDSVVEIRCTISEAFAGTPFHFALKRKDIPELMFLPVLDVDSFSVEEFSRSTTYKFKIGNADAERIFCFAPVLGSYEWINASRPIHVIVLSAPMFLQDSKSNNGTLETRVRTFNVVKQFNLGTTNEVLMCNATGEPSPEISWTWNKQKVTESKGEWKPHQATWSQLWFPHVDKTIEGEYICKATNSFGVVAATFRVIVVENNDPTIAIAISVPIVVIVLVAVATVIVIRTKRSRMSRVILTENEYNDFLYGKKETNNSEPNSKIFSKAFETKYIIDKQHLEFNTENILGSGQYGIVLKGWFTTANGVVTAVAVKTTKKDADVIYVKTLLSEIQVMAYIGDHQNIAKFIGTCIKDIKQGKVYAAMEFCENGDLLRCLQNQKALLILSTVSDDAQSVGYINTPKNKSAHGIADLPSNLKLNLLQWSRDIASGMAFISSKNVIHGDLAARNVLLTKDNVAKISDFGLARQLLNDYSVYTKKTKEPLPWKWMAIESLTSSKFSVQSDVWAFGVTLWEIFSLGDSPYPGCTFNEEFLQKLSTGTRPLKPQFASNEIFNIMERCWNKNPQMRPEMSEVYDQLHQQLQATTTATKYVVSIEPNEAVLEDSNA